MKQQTPGEAPTGPQGGDVGGGPGPNGTKEPTRTCVGCGKKQPKSLLHRLVLTEQDQPVLDRTQTAPGRGAYLCGPGCLGAAVKRRALQRAFKRSVMLEKTTLEADLQSET